MPIEIPDVVIDRLPMYARALAALERNGREVVSSQELGSQLGITPAQIRKDLDRATGGQPAPQQGGGADLLGSLLSGMTGQPAQGSQPPQDSGIDLGDVLNAGMAFMNAKNQGQDNLQAGLSALMAAGPLGQSSHRQQSGQVVGNALMQAMAAMAKGK